jgi:cytochrome bd-type quinol oxidase subunit 2
LGTQSHLRSEAALWIGVLVPPIAWATDLTVSYAFVKWTCGHQSPALLHAITFVTLIAIGAGGAVGWTAHRRNERAQSMAMIGALMTALFVVLTIALAIPRWVFDVCQ